MNRHRRWSISITASIHVRRPIVDLLLLVIITTNGDTLSLQHPHPIGMDCGTGPGSTWRRGDCLPNRIGFLDFSARLRPGLGPAAMITVSLGIRRSVRAYDDRRGISPTITLYVSAGSNTCPAQSHLLWPLQGQRASSLGRPGYHPIRLNVSFRPVRRMRDRVSSPSLPELLAKPGVLGANLVSKMSSETYR